MSFLTKASTLSFALALEVGFAASLSHVLGVLVTQNVPTGEWPALLSNFAAVEETFILNAIGPSVLILGMLLLGRRSHMQTSLRRVLIVVFVIVAFFLAGYYTGGAIGYATTCSSIGCPAYYPSVAYGVGISLVGILFLYFSKMAQRILREDSSPHVARQAHFLECMNLVVNAIMSKTRLRYTGSTT